MKREGWKSLSQAQTECCIVFIYCLVKLGGAAGTLLVMPWNNCFA